MSIPRFSAERLIEARERRGWTKRQLAEHADLGFSTVKRMEQPGLFCNPTVETMARIARVLGCSIETFVVWSDEGEVAA